MASGQHVLPVRDMSVRGQETTVTFRAAHALAPNLVSRLESLSLDLDPPIVVSEPLARSSKRSFRELGRFALKGIPDVQMALTPEPDSAASA